MKRYVAGSALVLAIALIQPWEGRKSVPYRDLGGVWTVCDGHTGDDIVIGKTYSNEECDALLEADVKKAQDAVRKAIARPLNPKTEAAIISFTYNVGGGALKSSTLARLANAGDIEGACNQLPRWRFVKGVEYRGLLNRRLSEKALCLEGINQNPWWGV